MTVQADDLASAIRRRLWSLLFPVVILIGVSMVAAIRGYQGDVMMIFLLGGITLAIGTVPIAINNALPWGRGHVLISFLALVYSAYFAVPALFRYAPEGGAAVPGSMGDQFVVAEDLIAAQLVAISGLLALLISYSSPMVRLISPFVPRPRFNWRSTTVYFVAIGMLVVGWSISIALSSGTDTSGVGTGFISTLASAQLFALILFAYEWEVNRSRFALLILAVVVPLSAVFGLLTGSKREALNSIAIVVIALMVLRQRISWKWVAGGVIALSLLYPVNRYYQEYLIGGARTSALEALTRPGRVFSSLSRFAAESDIGTLLEEGLESTALRLDGLGVSSVIIRETPARVPYQNGRTLALLFIAPIPRALWPDKPVFTVGQWVTDSYSHGLDTRTAPTQVGELYFNFGVPGVIGGMILLGFALRLMNETMTGRAATVPSLLFSVVVIYYVCTKFESAIAKQYANILFAVGPLVVVHAALRAVGVCVDITAGSESAGRSAATSTDDEAAALGGFGR